MAKKMNNFLGHCCFIPFYPIVFLAKLRFLGRFLPYSLLISDHPQKFVCIAGMSIYSGHRQGKISHEQIL